MEKCRFRITRAGDAAADATGFTVPHPEPDPSTPGIAPTAPPAPPRQPLDAGWRAAAGGDEWSTANA